MKERRYRYVVLCAPWMLAVFLVLFVMAVSTTNAMAQRIQTEDHASTALQALKRFTVSRSLDDLHSTVNAMGGSVNVWELTPQNLISKRRLVVSTWAQILSAIEHAYDTSFDPSIPFSCPAPPRESDGTRLAACVDPNDVRDPSARSAYVAALAAFKKRLAQAAYYQRLRNIDDWAMASLRMSLDVFRDVSPDGTSADFTMLDSIVRNAGLSSSRRTRIDAMLYPSAVH